MRQPFVTILAFALGAGVATAQPAVEPAQLGESISVQYVLVPFTVLGSKGRPITDLRKSEVALLVDGVPVASDLFEKSQNAPVSFTILVDGSGSMGLAGKMESARAAVDTLLAKRLPGDEFSLYVFADDRARELVPFTDNVDLITKAMTTIKPWGKTAFFDALATMPERSELGKNPTRAIILLSDGIDNASHLTKRDLARKLEGISIPIYPLGLRDAIEAPPQAAQPPSEELSDVALLDEVASLTGGKVHLGTQPEQLTAGVENLQRDLRAQYLVGFSPTGKGVVKYRHISLKIDGRIRAVRVRAGYRGTEPPALAASTRTKKSRTGERKGS